MKLPNSGSADTTRSWQFACLWSPCGHSPPVSGARHKPERSLSLPFIRRRKTRYRATVRRLLTRRDNPVNPPLSPPPRKPRSLHYIALRWATQYAVPVCVKNTDPSCQSGEHNKHRSRQDQNFKSGLDLIREWKIWSETYFFQLGGFFYNLQLYWQKEQRLTTSVSGEGYLPMKTGSL